MKNNRDEGGGWAVMCVVEDGGGCGYGCGCVEA